MKDYVTRMREKQSERIAELARLGVAANAGPFLGAVTLLAGEINKLLRALRRLERLEGRH